MHWENIKDKSLGELTNEEKLYVREKVKGEDVLDISKAIENFKNIENDIQKGFESFKYLCELELLQRTDYWNKWFKPLLIFSIIGTIASIIGVVDIIIRIIS